MVPVEEGELPKEGRVASRGGRGQEEEEEGEFVAAGAADGAAGVGGRLGGSQRQPSDQGLEKLERAKGLLLEGGARVNIGDVNKLLKQSRAAFFEEHSRSLSEGEGAAGAAAAAVAAAGGGGEAVAEPWRGAPLAATVCITSELAFPEAIALVRWFCSQFVASLCEVARVAEGEARKLEGEGKSRRKSRVGSKGRQSSTSTSTSAAADAGASAGMGRAARLLRVLITSFNAFLRHCSRSRMYSKTSHVHVLDIAVSLTRKAIEKLAAECSADPAAGTAAARLRGLTAKACFTPLSVPPGIAGAGAGAGAGAAGAAAVDGGEEGPPSFDNLKRVGNRDVEKLLFCISGGKAKKDVQYLRLPGNCVEAIGALRSVAVAVPQMYHIIADAFAAAVKCLTLGENNAGPEGEREGGGGGGGRGGGGEGEWGGRPALRDAAVRHTLFACSSHLADSLGRSPDASCLEAHGRLVSALKVCYVMRGFVASSPPRPLPLPLPLAADADGAKASAPVAAVGEDEVAADRPSPAKRSKGYPAARTKDKDVPGTKRKGAAGQESAVAASAAAPAAAVPAPASLQPPPSPPPGKDTGAPAQAAAREGGASRGGAHAAAEGAGINGATPTMSGGGKASGGSGGGIGRKRPRSPSPLQEEGRGGASRTDRSTRDPAPPPARPPQLPPTSSNTTIAAVDLPQPTRAAAVSATTTSGAPSLAAPQSGSTSPAVSSHTVAVGTGAAAEEEASVAPPSAPSAENPPPLPPSPLPLPLHSSLAEPCTSRALDSPAAAGDGGEENPALMEALFGDEDEDGDGDGDGDGDDDEHSAEAEPADAGEEMTPDAAKVAVAAAALAAEVAAATVNAGYPNSEERTTSLALAAAAAATPATATATATVAAKKAQSSLTATKAYPPLKSAPEKEPKWRDGDRYEVVLGDSFYASSGNSSGGGSSGDGPFGQEQYVHLKYDFVPARTNLDAPAKLRQRPITAAEGGWKGRWDGRGGDGGGSGGAGQQQQQQQQRWAAELEYESRDPSNCEPVRFSGDASRAQDVECVLVFDGKQFVMDRVSVVGGLKNMQEFTDPGAKGAGEPTPEAAMAKKKKSIKDTRSMKEREEKKKAKAAEKAQEMAAKAAAQAAAKEAKATARAAAKEAKAAAKNAAKAAAKEEKTLAKAAAKLAEATANAAARSAPRQQSNGRGGRHGGACGGATGNILG